MTRTFEFCTESRSAWRRSLDRALQLVAEGKMTVEEFLAAARPSPDSRDPLPATKLRSRLAVAENAEAAAAAEAQHRAAETARRQAAVESLRGQRVWALSGFYLEDATPGLYTLDELRRWADSWGYVFAGQFGGSPTMFSAVADSHGVSVTLNHDVSNDRRFSFAKAASHLAGWIVEQRKLAAV